MNKVEKIKISLIIATYKAAPQLKKVMQALAGQTRLPYEVIVAEDGEDKETQIAIREEADKLRCSVVHVRHRDAGRRKCLILNKAIVQAQGDYCVFLDGDCVPNRKFIEDHAALAEVGYWVQGRRAYIKEEAVQEYLRGSSLLKLFLKGKLEGVFKGFRYPWSIVSRDEGERGIIGCNLAAWKKDIQAINGFDLAYDQGWGREDSDFAFRLYHLGVKRKFVHGRAIVYHLNHPMVSRDNLEERDRLLEEAKKSRKIRCEQGIHSVVASKDLGEIFRYGK